MLTNKELQDLSGELELFKTERATHEKKTEDILRKYESLLADYYRLKSDYEEEREAREKYKRIAKDGDRNPFVFVLVDGDGYVFHEQLIRAGGTDAAQLLHQEIKEYLRYKALDNCRIMVRVYANLHGLGKALNRAGNEVKPHGYALGPFAANFTRSQDLFEFIDAGDKKEGADFKIKEMFRLFIDSSQCKHIIFAGCHDAGYLSLITPHQGKSDRITLLKGPFFSKEFLPLRLPVIEFPSVFRSVPLAIENHLIPPQIPSTSGRTEVPSTQAPADLPATKTCVFFEAGKCKYGKNCMFVHATQSNTDTGDEKKPPTKFSKIHPDTVSKLPQPPTVPFEIPTLPINKHGHRLDTALPQATPQDWAAFNARASQKKFCNAYQLGGNCMQPDCSRDHSPQDPAIINMLRYVARRIPCRAGGACRDPSCYSGHHCLKHGCNGGGGGGGSCRFPRAMHNVDLDNFTWERQSAISRQHTPVSSTSGANTYDLPDSESRHSFNSEGVRLGMWRKES